MSATPLDTPYQTIIDALPSNVVVINQEGIVIAVNRAWREFARTYADLGMIHVESGFDLLQIYRSDQRPEMQQHLQCIQAVLAGAQDAYTFEVPAGAYAHSCTTVSVTAMDDRSGALISYQLAPQPPQPHELPYINNFRIAFEQAMIGMAFVSMDGRWMQVNQALCNIVGFSEAEMLANTFYDITHPDDREADRIRLDKMISDEFNACQIEKRYIHKSGAIKWVLLSSTLIRGADHQPLYLISQIQDITARKEIENVDAHFKALVTSSDEGIFSSKLDGTILSWNTGAERIYGYTSNEAIGQSVEILGPPHMQAEILQFRERLRYGGHITSCETVRRHKDGRLIDVALTLSPIYDQYGAVIGVSSIAQDISERKRAEQELHRQTVFVQLLQAVAVAANQATSITAALETAIEQICKHIGWPVGHAYLVDEVRGDGLLVSTKILYLADEERFAVFRKITEQSQHSVENDLPSQVLVNGKPAWVTDMAAASHMPRVGVFRDIGVRAGFALPVLTGAEVVAVLEFFSTDAINPDDHLLEVMTHVGTQLGRVIERARAESALRESEELYRLITENTGDIVMLLNKNNQFVYVSPICRSLLGYDPSDMFGKDIFSYIHQDDLTILGEMVAGLHNQNVSHTIVRSRHADGDWRWIELRSTSIIKSNKDFTAVVARDVTERIRSEDALRAAELQYRTLVEQMPAIIYTIKKAELLHVQYISPQIKTILGFDPNEWVADTGLWLQQIHPEDRDRVATYIDTIRSEPEPGTIEYRMFDRDGQIHWFHNLAWPVQKGADQPLLFQGILLDITERKRAEERIQRSEQLYRIVANNFPNGVLLLFDRSLCYTVAGGAGLNDIGLTREMVEGKTLPQVFSEDLCKQLEPAYQMALGGSSCVLELSYAQRTYLIYTIPVKDEHDDVYAGMAMTQDITERKHFEEALVQERALLSRRVEERTADLSAANAELARGARLKDEFLASMSHELRTPLNAVLGLSEALQEEVYGSLTPQQAKALQNIEESGRHLLDLINDILDLAKIGAGKIDLDMGLVAMGAVCQASLRLIKQEAQKKRLNVDLEIDPSVTLLYADARRIKQILVNLLSNAVKFTPEGGLIGLKVVGDAVQQAVHFIVWDTGIGIAEEDMARLFEPFVQLDSRLARQYNGTGLGLALVYRMAEMHGGSVTVKSHVGGGSQFTVSLPWQMPTQETVIPEILPAVEPPTSIEHTIHRVLIVEDSPTTAAQLVRYLGELQVTAMTHAHGDGTVAHAIEMQPDLIILDILLPDTTGWEVLEQLKSDSRTRSIPVLIISVMDDQSYGLSLGAAGYLVKPFTRQDVQQVLQRLSMVALGSHELISSQSHMQSKPVVLLAEDNEANITTLSDYLAIRGYRVVVARNGAEAIARAHEIQPAIILMDIQMPGMDGLEATRRIRAHEHLKRTPIIALTALAMPGDRERCLAAGANDYFSKPVSLKSLAIAMEMQLQAE